MSVDTPDTLAPGDNPDVADELETAGQLGSLIAGIDPDHLELPAFPDVVTRLQVMLADPEMAMRDLAALIQSDPVLTAKLLRTANSAAFNTKGVEIDNLNVALNRLGSTLIRSIAMAFAMQQAEQEPWLAPIKGEMRGLLRRSNHVAAIACVVARQLPDINADQAILAGLVHQIGTLWLMITVQKDHVELTENLDYQDALEAHGPAAARAVLTTWKFPAEVCEAVGAQDQLLDPTQLELSLMGQLLAASKLRDRMENDPLLREQHPNVDEVLATVMFGEQSFVNIVAASRNEIADIQDALSSNLR